MPIVSLNGSPDSGRGGGGGRWNDPGPPGRGFGRPGDPALLGEFDWQGDDVRLTKGDGDDCGSVDGITMPGGHGVINGGGVV